MPVLSGQSLYARVGNAAEDGSDHEHILYPVHVAGWCLEHVRHRDGDGELRVALARVSGLSASSGASALRL